MRINEFLSELLDRPLPIKWEEEPGYLRAYFDVNGKEGMVKFYYEAFVWTIDFFIDGRHDITGQGNELAIFSTVSKAILEFISKHNPNLIAFSAKEPSRAKLYKRMSQRLTGYTIDPELSKQAGFGLKKIRGNELPENFAEEFTNYQGLRPPKNVPGTNLFPGQDIVGQRVYHCTNRLEAIKKSGGLKPRRDDTGEREYGRLSTDEHPFIPVIGIWFNVGKPDWPGKHCVSFVIEPTDQVYVAYASIKGLKPNVVLNPIALDRLTIEGQQDVKENFADDQTPSRKELDPDVYEDLANSIIARVARQIVPTIRAKSTPEGYVYLSTEDGLSLVIGCNIAGGSIDINLGSQPMETASSGPHKGAVTKIISAVYQAAVKRYGTPTEQGTLSIDHDAGHGVWQHIAQKLGLQYDAHMVKENFANGRNPQDKGDSKRHGINTKASVSSLRKSAKHSSGRKRELEHWLANMKAGRKK